MKLGFWPNPLSTIRCAPDERASKISILRSAIQQELGLHILVSLGVKLNKIFNYRLKIRGDVYENTRCNAQRI